MDNSLVTMATNFYSVEPKGAVKRWDRKVLAKVSVPQPRLFKTYNSHMGGVDLVDQGVNAYRVGLRSKRWYFAIFTYFLDLAVYNAWRLHKIADGNMDELGFRRSIVRSYLRDAAVFHKVKGKREALPLNPRDQPALGHWPKKLLSQQRCRICHAKCRWQCEYCRITLCIERDCFKKHHMQ